MSEMTVAKPLTKPLVLSLLGLPLSEKQIPQVVENLENGDKPREALERAAMRPRQVRCQVLQLECGSRFEGGRRAGGGHVKGAERQTEELVKDAQAPCFHSVRCLRYPHLPTPTTATGTLRGFVSPSGSEDGTGTGTCIEMASVSLAGQIGPTFSVPITFGQVIDAVETVSLTCHKSGFRFSDYGNVQMANGLIFLYDANGKQVGQLTPVAAPEPAATFPIFALGMFCLVHLRKRFTTANPDRSCRLPI